MEKSRIDKFISSALAINKRDVKLLLAQNRVEVDGAVITDAAFQINKFSLVKVSDKVLQDDKPVYIMLNKPIGVVSATKDKIHKTVIDLLPFSYKEELHIVGRLDLNTSGLMLLTNDSSWSERLTLPNSKVPKVYQVTLKNKLTSDYIEAFKQGMYFNYEDKTTEPAELTIESDYIAQVILMEGKYHQIKRMFGRFQNQVMALHRSKIGRLLLDENLQAGESRELTADEVKNIFNL
ncbi:pseudouridine synthase [Pseudocolwellia agarivorans]|uniref:pseudouridine synthase n=1 Tax=Pseudocolwellia agarivorans TaxID=1911682 RepID=UPI00098786EA|nr:pseudouridine synthase [Pseudocolwellia agarivorans]